MNETGSSLHRSARSWWRRALLWLALALFSFAAHAQQQGGEKRMALVIGNARYPQMSLTNPENDARVVASTLRRLGFDVTERVNLGTKEFRKVLRDYARRVENEEGASVFYYAGHGVQIEGRNYLLPVDINLRDEYEIRDEGVDIEELFVGRLERARSQVRIVILDACRDNPFTAKSRTARGVGGLAEMAARGALIAYATAPGATAEDGPPGTNSVFTRHLAKEMLGEGIEVEQMFKNVRVKVMRDTSDRQVPWVNTSMTRNFSFNPVHGSSGADEAKREELTRLQALLDQREREQKRLEEQLQQLSKRLEQAPQNPAASASQNPVAPSPQATAAAAPSSPAAKAALQQTVKAEPPVLPLALDPRPGTASGAAVAGAIGSPRPAPSAAATPTAASQEAYQAAKAWMAERERARISSSSSSSSSSSAAAAALPRPPAESNATLSRPQRPGVAPPEDGNAAASQIALSRPATARAASSGNDSERCVALLIRAQLGEVIAPTEMNYLKKECR